MKFILNPLIFALILVTFNSCSESSTKAEPVKNETATPVSQNTDNSQTSLDWAGTYSGTVPCADCSGIQTEIELNKDLTYSAKYKYVGKSENIIAESGSITWDNSGGIVILKGAGTEVKYKVGENRIIQLDKEGNENSGELATSYILQKKAAGITDINWVLIELYGKPIAPGNGLNMAPHITLNTAKNKVLGNSGCNSIGGSFELIGERGIKMSNIFATMSACGDTDSENLFQRSLRNAQSYELQGNELILSEPEWAVSARLVKE